MRCYWNLVVVLGALFPSSGELLAQNADSFEERPAAERFLRALDRNRDGMLSPEELQQLPEPTLELLQRMDFDLSRPIDRDEFLRLIPVLMEALRAEFDSGDARRSFRDIRADESADSRSSTGDRRFRRAETFSLSSPTRRRSAAQPKNTDGGRSQAESSQRDGLRTRRSASKSRTRKTRPRVAVLMPSQFQAGDSDGDGQIGFYEWRKWKRSATAEFNRLDRNNDGFLTPRELVLSTKGGQSNSPVTVSEKAAPASSSNRSGAARSSASTQPTASQSAADSAGGGSRQDREARYYFSLMDRNKDGSITSKEWSRSRRLKPMFEKAGADLSQSMSKQQFVDFYVQVTTRN